MNTLLKRTIFNQERQIEEMEPRDEYDEQKVETEVDQKKQRRQAVIKQLRQLLKNKQNLQLRENLISLKNRKILEGFSEEILPSVQQCFYFFSQALANARSLKVLDISGMDIHPLLAIEIGQGLQHNASLRELHMCGCKMNSFCLQYIFSSVTNHKTLQTLNFYNNQGFTIDLMNDFSQFILKGKNHLKKIKLTHCNISSTAMSYLLRNIKYSESICQLDLSMMHFNTEVLTSLGIALQHFKGKKVLEYLNVSDANIRDDGLETLAQRVDWNIRKINLRELVLSRNFFTQQGVPFLETFLRKIAQLQKLDLTQNKIEEFSCQDLHQRKMYEINLSNNCISIFPPYFFMNTLVVNLSNNNISSQGAFQLSSILRSNPLWIELNLSNNTLKSEGFNSIIFGLRDNKMLKKLIVANNQLDGEAIICYMINHEQVYFEYLDISCNQIRQQLIFVLLNFIKSGCLRALRCSYLQADDEIKKIDHNLFFLRMDDVQKNHQIFQLTSFNLVELDFHGNKDILTTVVTSLSTYFNKIEKLNLSSCSPVNDSDIDQLCQFLRKSTMIRDLNLSNLNLGCLHNDTVKKLSDAIHMSSLKQLNLSKNRLYKQMKRLFSVKNQGLNFRLETLDLSQNCLEGKHLINIEKMLTSYRNLQDINLSRNCLNFECLFAINRALQQNRSIKRLNLSYQKLSADDLLILSQTLGSEGLQELILANNPYTSKMKTFFNQCSTQRQDFLHFSNVYFDDANFQSLLTILHNQRRNLQGVTLDSCIFKNNNYITFTNKLYKCRNLKYYALIYNPTIKDELGGIIEKIPKFRSLRVLRLNQVSLTLTYLQGIAEFMQLNDICALNTLDLSQNKLLQEYLDIISSGMAQNRTIKQLLLNDCKLGSFNLFELGNALSNNPTLQVLELASNKIMSNLEPFLVGLNSPTSVSALRELNLSDNPLCNNSVLGLFMPAQQKRLSLAYINLTNCHLQPAVFTQLYEAQLAYGDKYMLCHIQSLCLCNNRLSDKEAPIIKQILKKSNAIRELQLQNNSLTSEGCLEIMDGILENETVRTLDIQANQADDIFASTVSEKLLKRQLKNLEFILLRKNLFTQEGQRNWVKIIAFQQKLFIDNIWSELDDNDAEIIIRQYVKIGQTYRLESVEIPNFLKEIQIQRAFLTDKFCECLARYYHLLSFIEFIDISDNPYITMYGKVYLFIHLFDQSFGKHQFKAMYITDSQETRKLFDDGLLRYLLLRFRNFINPPKQITVKSASSQREVFRTSNTQLDGKAVVQKIIGGLCGAWILHKINKLMTYLDQIEPPQFIVSTLFIGKFRTNNINIKSLVIFFWISSLLVNGIQYLHITYLKPGTMQETHNRFIQNNCKEEPFSDDCSQSAYKFFLWDIQLFALVFGVTLSLEIFQLLVSIVIRRKIQPAFQIVHPSMLKYLHTPYPHKKEIMLMFESVMSKLNAFPERLCFFYVLIISEQEFSLSSEGIIGFDILFILFFINIIARSCNFFILLCYNNIRFLSTTPKEDQAKYLQLLQKKMYYEGYYILSDILVALCPVKGYQLTKSLIINEEIVFALVEIAFLEVYSIFIFSSFLKTYGTFIKQHYANTDPFGLLWWWAILGVIKCVISIFSSLFRILTIRPAVVKQHGFNQALTIKKYYENKNMFVIPSHIKIEYEPHLQIVQPLKKASTQKLDKTNPLEPENSKVELKGKMDEIQEDKEGEGDDDGSIQEAAEESQSILHSESSSYGVEAPADHPLSLRQPKFKFSI